MRAQPAAFYAAFFLLTYELTVVFWDALFFGKLLVLDGRITKRRFVAAQGRYRSYCRVAGQRPPRGCARAAERVNVKPGARR